MSEVVIDGSSERIRVGETWLAVGGMLERENSSLISFACSMSESKANLALIQSSDWPSTLITWLGMDPPMIALKLVDNASDVGTFVSSKLKLIATGWFLSAIFSMASSSLERMVSLSQKRWVII